ncbi:aspartate/glutamate racemase family protein [Neisseria sp. N95_16]|uniref:Amino acid racemase n=1 Tax=Neisseria brasiliensis TaxID=2666100 RepID=A0A7X2GZ40_9NEIS|nr:MULTISPECIES: aspartate/glutamate racemase family protein [Neisseria]MRN38648.1 amino acid racemase [Neisseria brasiliensis]PJO09355.1 aspartate/glutamate racemase family protein [Neisseria sp. N95_16]
MKTLGIIGGMSPESTAIYYQEINRLVNQKAGGNHSAPMVMLSVDFEEIVQRQKSVAWQETGKILAEAAVKLESIGAQGILLATNTMHKNAAEIQTAVQIPFLHILDATVAAIKAQGIKKVGVLGTAFTMQDAFYKDGLKQRGIEMVVPDEQAQAEVHRIIFEELCLGKILPESRDFYLDTVQYLAGQGAEGVILGCTEIGLLIQEGDHALPFFDTAALHAQAAADFVLRG